MTNESDNQNSKTQTKAQNSQAETNQVKQQATEENQPDPKVRRPRKSLEQQLAEAEGKRREIKAAMRKQEDRKKIVFGAIVISMLKDMREKGDQNGEAICELIETFAQTKQSKDYDLIHEVIEKLMDIIPVEINKNSIGSQSGDKD